ncbi:MAG TPA: hypothetical protein VGC90_08710, partial [Candidatus Limnocylindrales bacterium]
MAVRLQLKVGVVPEQDRVSDSPDTVVIVEPSVGSIARSKGHLYLLVTSRLSSSRAAEATRIAAETIRNEYYYDESAGIRVCLEKAIGSVNKRLAHQRDRLGLGSSANGNGPIGIGVAVVRGNELYVATVGPAEAYLIRQARLSTLPDPHRDRGLPAGDLEPDVWRGEISVGDSLVLISPNVVARLGPDELKDAMVTLHPQSAIEHLHQRFVAADGRGSDGAIAFEATEVASTHKSRALVPVRPPEPLAGTPDRSPIPLADPVAGGVAAVQAGARQAADAAGGAFGRAFRRLQDFLPRRNAAYRRVSPISARRESQRRAAVAVLAFVVVAVGLGLAVFVLGSRDPSPNRVLQSVATGQKALDTATADLNQVFAPGVDLVADDRNRAMPLLKDAFEQLKRAEASGIAASAITPIRTKVVAGLDRLFGVVEVPNDVILAFDPAAKPPPDLGQIVRGPDGAPYVLDRATTIVYRIDVKAKKAVGLIRNGTRAAGAIAAAPKLVTVGGPDLLVLDAKNTLWRWRPSDAKGAGTLTRVRVSGATSWGDDITAIGTYVKSFDSGLYNLYLVDPSEKQIRAYSPAADGSGFPSRSTPWLDSARPVDQVSQVYIDGDLFLVDGGQLTRYVAGSGEGWKASLPGDELLRKPPVYTLLASGTDRRKGRIYGYDSANGRVIALDKSDGKYVEQYRIAGAPTALADVRGMYVIPGVNDAPATLIWTTANAVHQSFLAAVP